mmetsp:Transcript_11328/g.26256  ORF Transcript_11328/g.26256 Transcript_11328/m.26256 type:complete len:456 (-) Transcript_11328:89-1456(-)
MSDQKAFKKRLKALMNRPENLVCADCTEKQPRWASLIAPPPGSPMGNEKIGAFMCLECSGSHRRLGVHITFVRSVNLDSWKEKEVLAMENGGNGRVNALFEAHLARSGVSKPDNTANGFTRERFIRDKYERRKFYDANGLSNYTPSAAPPQEETAPVRTTNKTVKMPTTATVRAPSEAARRRAESRQKRLAAMSSVDNNNEQEEAQPKQVAPAPSTAPPALGDLLDFASFPEISPPAPAPAPVQAQPVQEEPKKTIDLFADMSVSAPASGPAPQQSSTDRIMSLFNTPQPAPTGMMDPGGNKMMMVGGQQMPGQQQMNPMMIQQQLMLQQQQQQQMMMMQQAKLMQQQQQPNSNNMMAGGMMMQNGGPVANMQGINNGGGMQGNMANPRNMMMANQMMSPQPNMMMQPNNEFGMVPMGIGPSMSNMQQSAPAAQPPQPKKEDPFAQFGFDAFQSA